MKVLTDLGDVNYLAVLVAAIAAFAIGAIWYSPVLFAKAWQQAVGVTEEDLRGRPMAPTFAITFVVSLIGVFVLALFIGKDGGVGPGALAGLLAGLAIAGGAIVITMIYELRPVKLMAIDAGYMTVLYTAAGAIIGAW